MIEGCDVAQYQPSWEPEAGQDFVIIKATLGETVVDPKVGQHAKTARDAGLVVGFYHFLWPSSNSGTGAEQADFFLSRVPDLRPGELLVCDWESNNDGLPSVKDRDSFMDRVAERSPGHQVGCYANPGLLRDNPIDAAYFLWVAHWTGADQPADCGRDWTLWQYTDNPYDLDRADFASRSAMQEWAGGSSNLFGLTELDKLHWSAA